MNTLEMLDGWFQRRATPLRAAGVAVSLTWGPSDRNPACAWVDFETSTHSARLILWSDGSADLAVGDLVKGEVLLDEHREIWTEVGLDDVEATLRAWFESNRPH
jgi:hypothetical protein